MSTIIERLNEFVLVERGRFIIEHNNTFALSFGQIHRYYIFVGIVLHRYETISQGFMAKSRQLLEGIKAPSAENSAMSQLTAEQTALLEETNRLLPTVHLEIESFYLFAKILLDKVAHWLEFYFGPLRKGALDSHDDLVKRFGSYAHAKGLLLSAGFMEAATALKRDISDYRDYEISHEKSSRRMSATMWDAAGNMRISAINLYPTVNDQQVESKALHGLSEDLDTYLRRVMELLESNRDNCRLQIRPGGADAESSNV